MTDPYASPPPLLLDHADVTANLAHFEDDLKALDSLVAYGTHLIPGLLPETGADFTQLTVLGVFGRQALAMADATALLLRSGAVHSARLATRALFEASVYMEWIDAADSEYRARTFYVWNLRRHLKWTERATPGTSERLEMEGALKGSGLDPTVLKTLPPDVTRAEKAKVAKLLNSPKYRDIQKLFNTRRGAKPYDPEWYSVLFPPKERTSLRRLAKEVGRHIEYVFVYESGSDVTHGSLFDVHIHVRPGRVNIWPLRELRGFPEVLQSALTLLLRLYSHLIERFDPTRFQEFAARYRSHWRTATLARRAVTYNLPA
jgi:predicted component of type VI protein secretion system